MTDVFVHHRISFDEDMSCDEEEDNSSEKSGATSSSNSQSGMLRKKLNFDFADTCDLAYHEDIEDDYEDQEDEIEISTKKRRIFGRHDNSESSLELTPNTTYSPCRTRSGRVFNNSANSSMEEKPPKRMMLKQKDQDVKVIRLQEPRLPTPVFNPMSNQPNKDRLPTPVFNPLSNQPGKELHLLKKDLPGPPPLNYVRRPRSRIQPRLETPDSPSRTTHLSPPTNEVKAMKIFDDHIVTSPVTAPRMNPTRSRVFGDSENRRDSAPAAASNIMAYAGDAIDRKRKRTTNINPFTPTSILATLKKKARMTSGESSTNGSFELPPFESINTFQDETQEGPAKRLKVSDINMLRYEEEFIEIKEIASGTFGTVRIARHRLDGMIYAIKVTRHQIYGNTHEEKVAMNEVFAHAALMKHKHVVRYYNSWIENGRVYIQNEYCEGGSLAAKIQHYKDTNQQFTEPELKRILLHLSKGLQYIHSKMLVHLDIKPENIFISLDQPVASPMSSPGLEPQVNQGASTSNVTSAGEAVTTNARVRENSKSMNARVRENSKSTETNVTSTEEELFSGNESTDSGHHSGSNSRKVDNNGVRSGSATGSPVDDRMAYKIGDLGHVAQVHGDPVPEEGDCRYMAPELLAMDINREWLTKADIFSLGLTLYEAASLRDLPKNSLEDPEYEKLKAGQLPYLDSYSKDFNALLKAMVHPDPLARPAANRLANLQNLRGTNSSNVKSRSQLYQELKETKSKLKMLELELSLTKGNNTDSETPKSSVSSKNHRLIGRGCARSRSSNVIGSTSTPKKW